MSFGLKRPFLSQIPYKVKKHTTSQSSQVNYDHTFDTNFENDNYDTIDYSSDDQYNNSSNNNLNDSIHLPLILPSNYPPPLPKVRRDLSDLAFTHKSCAEYAAMLNKMNENYNGYQNAEQENVGSIPLLTASENVNVNDPPPRIQKFTPIYDNEVSEFIGDSIIGMITGLLLRKWFPHLRPGGLTEIRSKLVNRERLSDWAMLYRFDKMIILPPSSNTLSIRFSQDVLCGTFEAFVSSVFDQEPSYPEGLVAVMRWVEPLIRPYADYYSSQITTREKEAREIPKLGSLSFLNQVIDKFDLLTLWSEDGGPDTNVYNHWSENLLINLAEGVTKPNCFKSVNFPFTVCGQAAKKKDAKEIAAYRALKALGISID